MTIQELEEQVKVLQKEIEKMKVAEKEQKSGKWKPKLNEKYYVLNTCGSVESDIWVNDEIDNWRYNNIPIFQTEAECEQYKKFREDVLAHSYEFSEEEWINDDVEKYRIEYYFSENGGFVIRKSYYWMRFNTVYFKTGEDAQYIIDTYPEELKKWRI